MEYINTFFFNIDVKYTLHNSYTIYFNSISKYTFLILIILSNASVKIMF